MDNSSAPIGLSSGAIIYDSHGDLVGTLEAFHAETGYLQVLRGLFFIEGIFLPVSTVDHTSVSDIYPNVPREELITLGYKRPPDAI